MPMNDKGEWINPDNGQLEADEYVGYTICFCKQGIKLHQAGFESKMQLCGMCKQEVADAEDFFKLQDGIRAMSK